MKESVVDTVKTTRIGVGGIWMSFWEVLPDIVRLGVGVATLVYLIIKIRKEMNEGKR